MPIVRNQKRKKELKIMNTTINNKINKTVKRKSLTDYPIWMYKNLWLEIIPKMKQGSLQLLMNRKGRGKRSCKFLFYVPHQEH